MEAQHCLTLPQVKEHLASVLAQDIAKHPDVDVVGIHGALLSLCERGQLVASLNPTTDELDFNTTDDGSARYGRA
jgi:hypothetical protein